MTRLEALKELAKKVEAGDFPVLHKDLSAAGLAHHSYGLDGRGDAWEAFNGSLDAAKALHEAVLPGWFVAIWGEKNFGCTVSRAENRRRRNFSATADCPSRAWLSAILSALIAQEESA